MQSEWTVNHEGGAHAEGTEWEVFSGIISGFMQGTELAYFNVDSMARMLNAVSPFARKSSDPDGWVGISQIRLCQTTSQSLHAIFRKCSLERTNPDSSNTLYQKVSSLCAAKKAILIITASLPYPQPPPPHPRNPTCPPMPSASPV